MLTLTQAVIVEGRYDKIRLRSLLDATILETNGFRIFKDKEKMALIRALAHKKGIVILTDSDTAGFRIRRYLQGAIPKEDHKNLYHAYIPEILGKEKRDILEKAFYGPITPEIPASILQLHPDITVIYSEK